MANEEKLNTNNEDTARKPVRRSWSRSKKTSTGKDAEKKKSAALTDAQSASKPAKSAKPAAKSAAKAPAKAPAKSSRTKPNKPAAAAKAPAKAPKASPRARTGRKSNDRVRISFLGGLNEIGKNITLFETDQDIVLVDCGMAFPEEDTPGIDCVIPDFTYVVKNRDKVRGIVLTHGHEDHIGSLPYLLKELNIPVYGTRLTLGLVEGKLREHALLDRAHLNVVSAGQMVNFGTIQVEFIHVNHSIPDAVGFGIHTPAGTIVMTGDFKIDTTPIQGEMIDLARFAELGREGVLALLSDSTNAERPGFTASERTVGDSFDKLFRQAQDSRIIIATFASNIHRVQQIINCAQKYGRKVALSGRSMVNVMSVAMELGYLDVPEGLLIDIGDLNRYAPQQLVLITTGSQGEPMSALSRMAYGDHRRVMVDKGDFIIISANPIPGNEKTVGRVINELMKLGCHVVYESMYEVHVSGHACQGESKIIMGITKPKFFIPVHGEQKHLQKNAELGRLMGIPPENIFIGSIGSTVELTPDSLEQVADVPAGRVLVDGLGVGDVGSVVLRDRKHLAEDGLLVIVCVIDPTTGTIVSGPDIVSRGFVYVRESESLMHDVREVALHTIQTYLAENFHDWSVVKTKTKDAVGKLIFERTKRDPMILPVLMEV